MASTVVSLGDVAEFIRGINFKPDDVARLGTPGTVACLRTSNVQAELDLSDVWAVPKPFVKRAEQLVQPGDILVSSANSWNLVGKCCWIPELPWQTSFGGFVSVLRPNPNKVEPRFLYRWFASGPIQALLRSFGRQTTNISNLNIERSRQLQLPLPPLPEQRRIATILDKADALRAKRLAAVEQLNGLTQAMFLEMFGDPATNPRGLPRVPLRMLGRVVTGGTPSRDIPHYYGDEIEWIKSDNINTAGAFLTPAVERLSVEGKAVARTAPSGSILVTCIAGTPACIGNVAIADREVAFNQQINALIPASEVDPYFLYGQFVAGKKLVQQASTGGMKGMVSKSRFEGIQFIVPPQREQVAFGRQFMGVQVVLGEQHTSLSRLTELFASLQHQAFAGAL